MNGGLEKRTRFLGRCGINGDDVIRPLRHDNKPQLASSPSQPELYIAPLLQQSVSSSLIRFRRPTNWSEYEDNIL